MKFVNCPFNWADVNSIEGKTNQVICSQALQFTQKNKTKQKHLVTDGQAREKNHCRSKQQLLSSP